MTISQDGVSHKLKIHKVTEEFAGKYKFEADGRKTECLIVVEGVFSDSSSICANVLQITSVHFHIFLVKIHQDSLLVIMKNSPSLLW